MEAGHSSLFKKKLINGISIVNKPKRIRKTRPGVCQYCNKWFADGSHLYAHNRIHTGEKPFVCDVCQKAFNQNANLRRHLLVHYPTETMHLYCNICERQYRDKRYFRMHMEAHDGKKSYSCPICSKKFAYRSSLTHHMPTHKSRDKQFICRICNEGFIYENLLKYHMRIHIADKKAYECTLCKRVFSRSNRFHSHLMSIHNIKIAFQCETCKQRFPDRRALEIHYFNHRVNKCSKASQEELDNRNESEQCIQENVVKKSDPCNKHFPGKKTLEKHSLSHTGDKNLEASQNELNIKIESVESAENDITKNSDFSETFSDLYGEHQIKSEPEENFEIDRTKNQYFSDVSSAPQFEYEEIEFQIKTNPEQDVNITNTRYFCEICYEEISNDNMQEHLLSHTQQYVYVCPNCKKCFDSRSLLMQHTCSNDTDFEHFECYVCEETFSSKENLKKHLFTHIEETN